ncbi:noncanonical pyrimidine nucleotidase, YjjG family protein [Sporosarcina sp. NCCP-2716]|uniref:YjjG family noncanonical pyrimidine nucleotidase n=1 Tax=Sporosarcina sp. NCCP-2716 TaxID=2943679 RepID=UPI00203A7B1E|nr:YjjG family noncanonical pyrimidine nucleotidase [Sporosarcina sp. NCCP-2716]GKV68700.1 noncanonical pyrimidine nucleotidase, YjjG family protein [Sporosarcina sp. NCCP-2716]
MKYDVFLFDLDDTLLEFETGERNAFKRAFTEAGLAEGLDAYRSEYRAISNVLWRELEEGKATMAELKVNRFRQLFAKFGISLDADEFSEAYLEQLGKEAHLIDGVIDMLDSLGDARLAIVTNGFVKAQIARIACSPLNRRFEVILSSEEAGYQKPRPEIFHAALDRLGVTDKSRVLMTGDSLTSDIRGGNRFGIDTCWYNPNGLENETDAVPTYEIASWNEFTFGKSAAGLRS